MRGWYGHYSDYARNQPSYHERYNPVRDVLVGAGATVFDHVVGQPIKRFAQKVDDYAKNLGDFDEDPYGYKSSGGTAYTDRYGPLETYVSKLFYGLGDVGEVAAHLFDPTVGQAFSSAREVLEREVTPVASDFGVTPAYNLFRGEGLPSERLNPRARLSRDSVGKRYGMSYKRRPLKKRAYGSRTKQTRFGRYPASAMRSVNRSNGAQVLASKMDSRWEEIPKQVPSSLKYFDTVSGAIPSYITGLVYQLGGATTEWDPLGIAEYNVIPPFYAGARGAGSSRRGPKITVVAIEIMVWFANIHPIFDLADAGDCNNIRLLSNSDFKVDFYLDRQCNGAQFAAADVLEMIDTKSTNTNYPNEYNVTQTFPSVENDGRFEMLGRAEAAFRIDFGQMYPGAGATTRLAPNYNSTFKLVLKGPYDIAYNPRNNVSTGSGSIDQRKSLNINGLYSAHYREDALQNMSLYTSDFLPGLWIGSRTIFYDSN